MDIWQSSDRNNFAQFFLRHGVYHNDFMRYMWSCNLHTADSSILCCILCVRVHVCSTPVVMALNRNISKKYNFKRVVKIKVENWIIYPMWFRCGQSRKRYLSRRGGARVHQHLSKPRSCIRIKSRILLYAKQTNRYTILITNGIIIEKCIIYLVYI